MNQNPITTNRIYTRTLVKKMNWLTKLCTNLSPLYNPNCQSSPCSPMWSPKNSAGAKRRNGAQNPGVPETILGKRRKGPRDKTNTWQGTQHSLDPNAPIPVTIRCLVTDLWAIEVNPQPRIVKLNVHLKWLQSYTKI